MSDENLPVKTGDDFLAETEVMDLSVLKDKNFVVTVSAGDRSGPKYVCSTIRGPYSFTEMVDEVGSMWEEHQHHAKVVVLHKERDKAPKYLDENTVDYIECHYVDIITEAMLDGSIGKDYTCRANLIEGDLSEDPRQVKKETQEE